MIKLPQIFLASLVLLILNVPTVLAVELPSQAGNRSLPPAAANARDRIQARTQEGIGVGNTNPDVKLRACQARENAIKQRSEKLVSIANNMLTRFDSITERVKNFYQDKVVPSGKSVSNFDDLVSGIQAKKEVVTEATTSAKAHLDEFSCDNDNPKEQIIKFKDDMQKVKTALGDYRTSIKNLIVAVHSVVRTGTDSDNDGNEGSRSSVRPSVGPRSSDNPSESARPSRSPNANRGSDTGENEND